MSGSVFERLLIMDFKTMTPNEINMLCENNRLRRGLVSAEKQLTYIKDFGKAHERADFAIAEIREALVGGSGDLGVVITFSEEELKAIRSDVIAAPIKD
jgi:hypothetical protein